MLHPNELHELHMHASCAPDDMLCHQADAMLCHAILSHAMLCYDKQREEQGRGL